MNPFAKFLNNDSSLSADNDNVVNQEVIVTENDAITIDLRDKSVRNRIRMERHFICDLANSQEIKNFITENNKTHMAYYNRHHGGFGPSKYRQCSFETLDACVIMYFDDKLFGVLYLAFSDKYASAYELVDLYLSKDIKYVTYDIFNVPKNSYKPFEAKTELKKMALDYLVGTDWKHTIYANHLLKVHGSDDYSDYRVYYETQELEYLGFKLLLKGVEKYACGISDVCTSCIFGLHCKHCFCRIDCYAYDVNSVLKNRIDNIEYGLSCEYANLTSDENPDVQFVRF